MTEMAPAEDETETELRLSLGPPSNNKPSSGSSSEQQQLEKAVSDPTSDKHYGGLSLGMLSSSFPFAKQQQQEGGGGGGGGLSVMGCTSSRQMQTLAPKSGFVPSKRTYSDALVPAARQQSVTAVFPEQTDLNSRGSVSVNNGRNPHHHHPQLLHQALRWFPADSTKKPVVNTPRLPNPTVTQHQKQTINDKAQPSNTSNEACRTSNNPRPVVGWPPVRSFRRNSLVANNNSKPKSGEEAEAPSPDSSVDVECSSMYVKANMDGVPIGRKLDLKLYNGYASLKQALGEMFQRSIDEYVLTHEDKDGDWMLVGDVPWDMFLSTVRRLRLMKSSELGTAPLVSMGEDRRPRPRAC